MIKNLAIGGGSNRLMLIFALLLGLISAILVGVYLSGLSGDDDGGGPATSATVPVIVAAQDIPALTTVTADMVTVKSVPADVVLPGVFRAPEDVVGQTTQVAIVTGEQVLPTKVTSAGSTITEFGGGGPGSLLIPSGLRAYSIYVSRTASAGGLVRAGDHVDLVYSWDTGATDEGEATSGTSCYIAQDIEVFATGDILKQTTSDGDVAGLTAVAANGDAKQMTLLVSPQQVIQLSAYQKTVADDSVGAQMWVSLRPFTERGQVNDLPSCSYTP